MAAVGGTSRRRVVIVGLVIGALLAIGIVLSNIGQPDSRHERGSDPKTVGARQTVSASRSGPVTEKDGLPVGFSHDQDGAVSAAMAYATASQRWLYFTDDQIRFAVSQIASPKATARLTDDVVSEVAAARNRLGASSGRVWWLVRPLAWIVEFHETDEARISVWVVTVLSAAKVAAPQSEWMTVTVDLVWMGGDWHVDAVRDAPGPTPMTGPKDRPWDAEPFDEALSGFTRVDGEPAR